jgi:ABC-2 type transport system ATP-binding protein
MIEVKELCKNYGDRAAIDRLSFTVKKGEVVGFLGPNGAGKTTTMKIITGYMAPTSGSVQIAGFDVFENPIEVKRRVGYLPEMPPVYGDMIVHEYLAFVAQLKKVAKDKIKKNVEYAIEKTNLGDVRSRLIQNLSKGYRQRVGIAQALVSDPEILILDEPTVGLDPRQVAEIRSLLQELRGQHTIILSTHILPEVEATCDRVIIISKGKIVAQDSIQGLRNRVTGGKTIRLRIRRKASEVQASLQKISGVTAVATQGDSLLVTTNATDEMTEKIADQVVGLGAGLIELTQPDAGLEDIFIRLTNA